MDTNSVKLEFQRIQLCSDRNIEQRFLNTLEPTAHYLEHSTDDTNTKIGIMVSCFKAMTQVLQFSHSQSKVSSLFIRNPSSVIGVFDELTSKYLPFDVCRCDPPFMFTTAYTKLVLYGYNMIDAGFDFHIDDTLSKLVDDLQPFVTPHRRDVVQHQHRYDRWMEKVGIPLEVRKEVNAVIRDLIKIPSSKLTDIRFGDFR